MVTFCHRRTMEKRWLHNGGMIVHLAAVTLLLLSWTQTASADCECGYSVAVDDRVYTFTDLTETDFAHLPDIATNTDWERQAYNVSEDQDRGSFGEMFEVQNILANPAAGNAGNEDGRGADGGPAGLQLAVGATEVGNMVPTAEMASARVDMVYGTFRAGMRLTDVPGTCSAFFWYFNDTQEIDMEFLSKDFHRSNNSFPVDLVLQSRASAARGYDAAGTPTFARAYLPFDPTAATHEYRIDFLPGRVLFYADGAVLADMAGPAVPADSAGHLLLSHWSNGNAAWSGGPPGRDAVTTVAYVKAYFNSSSEGRRGDYERRCADPGAAGAVCRVPEVSAAAVDGGAAAANFFFTEQRNMTNNQTVSGRDSSGAAAAVLSLAGRAWWWSGGLGGLVAAGWLLGVW